MSVFTWAIREIDFHVATYARELTAGLDAVCEANATDLTLTVIHYEPYNTGAMIDATNTKKVGPNTYQTVVGVPYADFVNDGTRHMAPRYFAEHAVADVTPRALDRLTQYLGEHGIR